MGWQMPGAGVLAFLVCPKPPPHLSPSLETKKPTDAPHGGGV